MPLTVQQCVDVWVDPLEGELRTLVQPHRRTAPPLNISGAHQKLRARSAQIPDEVTQHFLNRAGFQCPDERVTRLISLAAHKFVADITNDAMVHSKARAAKANKEGGAPMGPVLTTEDLAASCKEYGITLRKPAYFADTPQQR